MIFNISSRTDIPAFYTPWLLNRLSEGYVLVRNPYDMKCVIRYDFHENDILCFVSKDFSPLIPYLEDIAKRFKIHLYYTVTGYGRDIERNVPSIKDRVSSFSEASKIVGKDNISWRYDPVMVYGNYDVSFHKRAFSYICNCLSSYTGLCIFSFISLYRGMSVRMPGIRPVSFENKQEMLSHMQEEAKRYGICLQSCAVNDDYSKYSIRQAGCISCEVLGLQACGILKRSRPGCLCVENRDIGAYGTCRHGCLYCYADSGFSGSQDNEEHDPTSPFLIGYQMPGDRIVFHDCSSQLLLDL